MLVLGMRAVYVAVPVRHPNGDADNDNNGGGGSLRLLVLTFIFIGVVRWDGKSSDVMASRKTCQGCVLYTNTLRKENRFIGLYLASVGLKEKGKDLSPVNYVRNAINKIR